MPNPASDFDIYAKARQAGSFAERSRGEKAREKNQLSDGVGGRCLTGAKGASGIAQQTVKGGQKRLKLCIMLRLKEIGLARYKVGETQLQPGPCIYKPRMRKANGTRRWIALDQAVIRMEASNCEAWRRDPGL